MTPIAFTVVGTPVPKQSFKAAAGHGYTPAYVKAWQTAVGWGARVAMGDREMLTGDLVVTLRFVVPDRRRRDAENLSKPVLDGCNSIVFADDSQVCELHVYRRVGAEPHVEIEVWEKGEGQ
jgi:Holliday junction resolvase RusA-like endonuclease